MKTCSKCADEKPLDDFYKSAKKGQHAWCKRCCHEYKITHRRQNAEAARLRNYRMTKEQFVALLAGQAGRCASCADEFGPKPHDTHVDHDHKTGEVRGVLCRHCNIALGHLRDEPRRIEALLRYLDR